MRRKKRSISFRRLQSSLSYSHLKSRLDFDKWTHINWEEGKKHFQRKLLSDSFKHYDSELANKIIDAEEEISAEKTFTGEEFLNSLRNFSVDSRLSADLILQIEETQKIFEDITDAKFRKNFAALKINPLLKDCEKFLKLYEETSALQTDYKIVCKMANELEKNFGTSETEIENMQAEINRLREKIARDDEKHYIEMSWWSYDWNGLRRYRTARSHEILSVANIVK